MREAFEQAMETHRRHLPFLLSQKHAGKFTLIHDNALVGVFDNYADAFQAGQEKFGVSPFFVRRIEPIKKHTLLLEYLPFLGIAVAIISVMISCSALNEQNRWNKVFYTSEILRQWDTQLGPHRQYIEAYFDVENQASKDPSRQPPDPCESKAIVHAKNVDLLRNSINAFEVKRHLIGIFDYLEDLAFAYVHSISDKPALKAEASPFIIKYYEFFRNFIAATNNESKADFWPALTEVLKEWKPEDIKSEPTPCA